MGQILPKVLVSLHFYIVYVFSQSIIFFSGQLLILLYLQPLQRPRIHDQHHVVVHGLNQANQLVIGGSHDVIPLLAVSGRQRGGEEDATAEPLAQSVCQLENFPSVLMVGDESVVELEHRKARFMNADTYIYFQLLVLCTKNDIYSVCRKLSAFLLINTIRSQPK